MQSLNYLRVKKSSWEKNKDRLPIFLISLFVILLLFINSPFSPFHKYCFEYDATAYKTVACGILKGKVPYKDLFDHKGPLTYFILALGFIISNGKNPACNQAGVLTKSASMTINKRIPTHM